MNESICARISRLEAYCKADHLLAYLNFGAEFAAERLVEQALADGKKVWLPKVNVEHDRLDLFRVRELAHDVAPGTFGIREPLPQRCPPLHQPDRIDLVLLPGVAFGRNGERLGYGGGYYDKLLATFCHRPDLVAAAFAMQVVTGIPQEATDRKVDWLVTEDETIRCNLGRE